MRRNESERDEETESGVKRERRNTDGRGRAKERDQDGPLSSATPADVPFPLSPLPSPVNPILEACRALPRTSQARFLNFVTFKFKHSHLLRSLPPQRLCLLPMPISCPFPFSPCLLSFSLILSLVYYLPSFVSLSVCARLYFEDFFCNTMKARAPTFR